MFLLLAFCGIDCTGCEAYKATQAGDRVELERIAAQWRAAFNAPEITIDSVICDGCQSQSDRRCGYCSMCGVRQCAVERQVANCAYCSDYGCPTISGFFTQNPALKTHLDDIRAGLNL